MNSRRIQYYSILEELLEILIFVFVYKDQLSYSSRRTIVENLNIEANDFSKNEIYNCFEHLDMFLEN